MTSLRILVLVLALVGFGFQAAAQTNALTPGEVSTAVYPAVDEPTLFRGSQGFILDIPENAVRVRIELTTVPPSANVDLFARINLEASMLPDGTIAADYSSRNVGGVESLLITPESAPPLATGRRYFIALAATEPIGQTFVFLRATVGLTTDSDAIDIIWSDDFEDGSTQAWRRNYPPEEPALPTSAIGAETSRLDARRGPGEFTRNLQMESDGDDFFLAPSPYLGNLTTLGPIARLEFDLAFDGDSAASRRVEIRLLGEGGGFAWFSTAPPTDEMARYLAPLNEQSWQRLGGSGAFNEVLKNVLRIEVRANFNNSGGTTFFDNVLLLGRALAPATPQFSPFEGALDGWSLAFPAAPVFAARSVGATQGDFRTKFNGITLRQGGGNPDGFVDVRDIDDVNRDSFLAPERYLGNLLALGPDATIEIDRRHVSPSGATRGAQIRLIGYGGAYAWIGPPPTADWSRHQIPLREENFTLVAGEGSFEDVVRAVQRIEVTVDEAVGTENSGLDNFNLIAPEPVSPELSLSPGELRFNAVVGGSPPPGRTVEIGSNGPSLEWVAASDAPWLVLERESGVTPTTVGLMVDPSGLSAGVFSGKVTAAWIGSPQAETVNVILTVVSETSPLISQGGVVNAASFTPNDEPGGELTGGMFVAIFGQRLASQTLRASAVPFPSELGGTSVTIGGLPAPQVFVSDLQLVVVVPQELTLDDDEIAHSLSEAAVVVRRGVESSPAEIVQLEEVRPLLFSQDQTGSGAGAILNLDGADVELNTFDQPASPLQLVSLFGTGFGPTQFAVQDGDAAVGLNSVLASVGVKIGGVDAGVLYAGLSPGSPHLYQVNAAVPSNAAVGCEIVVELTVGGIAANTITMAITSDGSPCR